MNIQIQGRKVKLTGTQRTRAERRLAFALARFGERIGRVVLRFSNGNGLGNVEKCCRIDVGLRPKIVRVEYTGASLLVALDRAADRASRSVARALDRERNGEGAGLAR